MDCPKTCYTEAVAGIPDDPLVEILSRVPAKSLCQFKCVSKTWRDLIADPHHRKKLPQTLEGFFLMLYQEHCEHDSCSDDGDGEDCSSDDGGGEGCSADVRDGEELPRQRYGFVDVLGTAVRPVDFSFLTELGNIEKSMLLHGCNGLLLFGVGCNSDISYSYIVCNPATKQYVPVLSSPDSDRDTWSLIVCGSIVTYLLFDPGVSSHFHLIQFWQTWQLSIHHISVYVYSSETHAWSHKKCDWDYCYDSITPNAYVNGMLHLLVDLGKDQLAAVDVEGNIQKIFPLPCRAEAVWGWPLYEYVAQSHGCLHLICYQQKIDFDHREQNDHGLSIWVLQDYDKQQWVLKDTVSFLKLFGKKNVNLSDYKVAGIHPDHSLVFLVQHWDRKLISYNMDSKEVRDLCTLGHGYKRIGRHGYNRIIPYVPYFLEFGA